MAKQICEKCGAKDSIKIDENEDTAFCIKCWYTQTKESSFTVDPDNPEYNPELEQTSVKSTNESEIKGRGSSVITDAQGNPIGRETKKLMKRIKNLEKLTRTPFERAKIANSDLQRNMSNLIPDTPAYNVVRATFEQKYDAVIRKKLQRGQNANLMCLATILLAYKLHQIPIDWDEIKNYDILDDTDPRWGKDKKLKKCLSKIISDLKIDTRLFYK